MFFSYATDNQRIAPRGAVLIVPHRAIGDISEANMSETDRIQIVYCRQCRWLLRAAWMAQELLTTFEEELSEVALRPVPAASPRCGWATR